MRKALGLGVLAVACACACACAAVLGIESVDYANVDTEAGAGEAGSPDTSVPPDAGDACTGVVCGARCCRNGAVCMDAGACSNDVIHVSAGGNGSCALVANGDVYCWGENALGQVGVSDAGDDTCTFIAAGRTIPVPCRAKPTRVGVPPARGLGMGLQLACAIDAADGSVRCWGRNNQGALGRPETDDPLCPDPAHTEADGGAVPLAHCNATPRKIPGITDAVAIVVSDSSACARTSAGKVFCWGSGGDGQLGDGTSTSSPVPVMVQGLPNDIVQLSMAIYGQGVCAVSADGHAWCWGGNIPEEPQSATAHAAMGGAATPFTDLAEIHLGLNAACARRKNGVLVCWGSNEQADLGRGICDLLGTRAVDTVIGVPAATALDGRWLHSCARFPDGTVSCWGLAQDGAMGQGVVTGDGKCNEYNSLGTPATVPGLPRIAKIATGTETSFAIDEEGRLWAWGAVDLGRLGRAPNADDVSNCGDPGNKTVCHPRANRVEGLP